MPSARSRSEVADLRRADTTAHSDRELEELLILDDVQASDDDQ
jgi:hypothetical protein